jgi:hypothetical protein
VYSVDTAIVAWELSELRGFLLFAQRQLALNCTRKESWTVTPSLAVPDCGRAPAFAQVHPGPGVRRFVLPGRTRALSDTTRQLRWTW